MAHTLVSGPGMNTFVLRGGAPPAWAARGAAAEPGPPGKIPIPAAGTPKHELDETLCSRIRASILLAGPLLARCGEAVVPPPGGDVIGGRSLDTHLHASRRLGAGVPATPAPP